MPSTYSPLLQLELIAKGEQKGVWGDTTNKNLGTLLEDAIAGVAEIDISSGSVTLTTVDGAPDEARCSSIILTGAFAGTAQVLAPARSKTYIVQNSSNASTLFRDTVNPSGVTIAPGQTTFIWWDGDKFSPVIYPLKLSDGLARGVVYLNNDKEFVAGSYIVSDGIRLGVGTSSLIEQLNVGGHLNFDTSASYIYSNGGNGSGEVNAGFLLDGENKQIRTYIDGVERMFIDSSGVGIGASATNRISFTYDGDMGKADIGPNSTSGDSTNGYTRLTFGTTNDGTYSERMRIDSSGNLLVGKTASGSIGVGTVLAPSGCFQSSVAGTATAYHALFYNNSGASSVGTISSNGSTTTYATASDYRLKENIQPMQNALGVVAQLNPVTYTWKVDGSDGQGFIAHELQAVVPDCVTGEKDAVDAEGKPVYQGIDTSFLVATLTKAIQEQQEQINQLKAEVAALKQ